MRTAYRLVLVLAILGCINALVNTAYATFMVFWVLEPEGMSGPLFANVHQLLATDEGYRIFMARRLYAQEGWVTSSHAAFFAIVATYCAVKIRETRPDPDGAEAEVVEAPACHAGGSRFESGRSRHPD